MGQSQCDHHKVKMIDVFGPLPPFAMEMVNGSFVNALLALCSMQPPHAGGDATAVQPSPLRTHCSIHNAARAPLPPSWAKNIGPKLFHQKRTVS